MKSARSGEERIHVEVPPSRVYELLSDVERMGERSPECYRGEWQGGARSPAVPGTRFKGWNRFGRMKWSMTCDVKAAEPDREVAWATVQRGREQVCWRYRLTPANGDTDVVESFEVSSLPLVARIAEDHVMRDRDHRRAQAMRTTLERIKIIAEQSAAR
jgi:Polyketide cyclase / dehydrase and lipid transport